MTEVLSSKVKGQYCNCSFVKMLACFIMARKTKQLLPYNSKHTLALSKGQLVLLRTNNIETALTSFF